MLSRESQAFSENALNWLTEIFSVELKIDKEKLGKDIPFGDYGIDSIMMAQITRKIGEKLTKPLDPSILFECSTLSDLAVRVSQVQASLLPQKQESVKAPPERVPAYSIPTPSRHAANRPVLRRLSQKSPRLHAPSGDIAVIGMSCRFPGANNLEEYWDELRKGRSAIVPVPPSRFEGAIPYYAGLIDSIEEFDNSFFLIADEDAKVMDPQGLLVLEESLNLFCHAGYSPGEVKGSRTGVYLGARGKSPLGNSALQQARNPILAVGQNYLAANISHFFDLRGPSLVVDTACSSALVAMNLGIKDLVSGEVDAAVVGGVSLLTDAGIHELFQQRNLLSRDTCFHIFDQRAGGVILGEGAGLVLLKTLEQARKDGDQIYAVVKSLVINNDGRTAGPATPSIDAQKSVMRAALQRSGRNPEDIVYIEANGSGSEVTDLLELKAIESVYRSASRHPCGLGSVKPNIGHPLCAEGIAGFIKLVLMLNHREWIPFLSGQRAMTHYDLESSPFFFHSERTPWIDDSPVVALNCFADGGTNAHVILEAGRQEQQLPGKLRKPLDPPRLDKVNVRGSKAEAVKTANPWTQPFDSRHPILNNHKAYGQELLPGLAYIDLLYQFFKEKGFDYRELELRNLSIYQPLIADGQNKVRLKIVCDEILKGSAWKIKLERERLEGDNEGAQYAVAEMHRRQPAAFSETLDLSCIDASFESFSLGDAYAKCRDQELIHTGVMKAEGNIYSSESAELIVLLAPEDSSPHSHSFMFHPALIDGSGVAAGSLFFPGQSSVFRPSSQQSEEKRLYLPLYYESFAASELLQDKCIVRIKRSSVREKNDLIILNLEFFNPSGVKVAELKNFASKLVRDAGMINPGRDQAKLATSQKRPPEKRAAPNPRASHQSQGRAYRSESAGSRKAEDLLSRILASKLQVSLSDVDVDAGYYEMGLTSAMLLGVVGELEKELSTSLTPTLLFEYPTIKELSSYLVKTYEEKFGGASTEATPSPSAVREARDDDRASPPVALATHGNAPFSAAMSDDSVGDIAVIGMAGKYPGAANIEEFWQNLAGGIDSVTEVPEERWDWHILDGLRTPSGKRMSKWGGFIDKPDYFDPQFFRISPREAKTLDPQERLFLEVCWEAIEDAGYTPNNLTPPQGPSQRRDVGVFVGVMHKDYTFIGAESLSDGDQVPLSLNYAPIANRVSYFCNFHGPSMAVDTVCSASLTAVHLGIQSLQRRESQVVLAGGVNLSLHPNKYLTYGLWDMHSSDGRCRAFGEGGDGYVSGEGVGAILLKPVQQAVRDRDHVYAIIKGSTINHVGKVSGITVPSPVAQSDMIQRCFEQTGIDPRTVSYIEAHGTGTSLGDPIEFQGLVSAFRQYTDDKQFCSLGSLKSNIGHAESAAGIGGLTKLILQLHHKTLVPSLHSDAVNPLIDLKNSPFYIQRKTEAWNPSWVDGSGRQQILPRRAGISSFGATGSNAHVIVEEYTRGEDPDESGGAGGEDKASAQWAIVPLSAKSAASLKAYAQRLSSFIQKQRDNAGTPIVGQPSPLKLEDIAYTLQVGRVPMEERLALVATSTKDLCAKLDAFAAGNGLPENCWTGHADDAKKKASFLTREDIQELVGKWASQSNLHKIAGLWAQGFEIAWESVWEMTPDVFSKPNRASLPTYPFSKERYWLDAPKTRRRMDSKEAGEVCSRNHSVIYYTSEWSLSGYGDAGIDPAQARSPVDIFVAAGRESNVFQGISTLKLADKTHQLSVSDDVAAQVQENTAILIRYCQELVRAKNFKTRHVLAYVPYKKDDFLYRYLMGALRTISLELPFLRTKLVFDAALGSGSLEKMQQNISAELTRWDDSAEVLYAEDQARYVLSQKLLPPVDENAGGSPFRHNGVYLITGGLGGLGRIFSRQIGKSTGSQMILLGRSQLTSEKKLKLTQLEAEGVNVRYVSCDTTRGREVQEVISQIMAEHGAINGVIHSAGEILDELIPTKNVENAARVLSAKVQSILVLDEATKDLDLDFFVSFSSVASFGNVGQIDYAAANSFLDTFSYRRSQLVARGERHGKSLSVNWPLWKDGGMSVDRVHEEQMFNKMGMVPLTTEVGTDALVKALKSPGHQFGVIEGSQEKILSFLKIGGRQVGAAAKASADRHQAPQVKSDDRGLRSAPSRQSILQIVLAGLSKVTGMEESAIDAEVPLPDYGVDSIGLMEFASYLNAKFNLNYTGAIFYELDDVTKIVGHLLEDEAVAADAASGGTDQTAELEPELEPELEREPVEKDLASVQGFGKVAAEAEFASKRQALSQDDHAGKFERMCIIGYDCAFPGASDAEQFWKNLCNKVVSTREVAEEEWKKRGVDFGGNSYDHYKSMKWSALLEGIDLFDAHFWGIKAEQAAQMDPQQRLLLQSIWHCVENSRYSLGELAKSRVGLYLALDSIEYKAVLGNGPVPLDAASSPGSLANQISHYCDFRGPSEAIDNACASVYVAVNKAAQAIALGECDVAIVAGAKILLDAQGFGIRDSGKILSSSERMYPFDRRADGYIRGEGVGCVLVKSLKQARADGDNIHAVIAGVGVTHNGSRSFSLLSPNVEGQCEAIQNCYRLAGIDPKAVSYIEAHGTGTHFNDAAEVAAYRKFAKEALDTESYRRHQYSISTVKCNIGHLEGASGVASMLKVIMALKHKTIAPIATFSEMHPSVLLGDSPLSFATTPLEWKAASQAYPGSPASEGKRRAGLHSVGIGGVNAHMILEEYTQERSAMREPRNGASSTSVGDGFEIITISAKSKNSLDAYCENWLHHLAGMDGEDNKPEYSLGDIAYSSRHTRDPMPYRIAFVVNDLRMLRNCLERTVQGLTAQDLRQAHIAQGMGMPVAKDAGKQATVDAAGSFGLKGLSALADAWVRGQRVDWVDFDRGKDRHRVDLPNYPFDNQSHWVSFVSSQAQPADSFEALFEETFGEF